MALGRPIDADDWYDDGWWFSPSGDLYWNEETEEWEEWPESD